MKKVHPPIAADSKEITLAAINRNINDPHVKFDMVFIDDRGRQVTSDVKIIKITAKTVHIIDEHDDGRVLPLHHVIHVHVERLIGKTTDICG